MAPCPYWIIVSLLNCSVWKSEIWSIVMPLCVSRRDISNWPMTLMGMDSFVFDASTAAFLAATNCFCASFELLAWVQR